ncbi:hypothetical protein [Isobaculum melis]|uniref:Alternate signal-mediated exported protein, CPF_0494 family n=1 Tax=Isobaculum melis TaxID=142588 RepID=A0A1H9RJ58_9LACT|nr:hypothetical protein [Isobaculum melis]SER72871.1 hypothetical protein SAMN04488559_10492 [Isobaculum melis]
MKKRLIILGFFGSLFILCFSLLLLNTQATFKDEDKQAKNYQVGNLELELVNDGSDVIPNPLVPNAEITKRVAVKNVANNASYVRVMLFPTIIDKNKITLEAQHPKQFKYTDLDTTNWMYGDDGYYYYLKKLEPGATTQNLLSKIVIDANIDAKYKDSQFDFEVKVEGINTTAGGFSKAWWNDEIPPNSARDKINKKLTE